MKMLIDYTDEELVNLTDEDRQTLFLLECAERGVPLPDATPAYMPEPKEKEENKPDMVTYSIGGHYSSDKFHFLKLEDAQAVAALIKSTAVYVSNSYSDKGAHLTNGSIEVEVNTNAVYSADKYQTVKAELDAYEKDKSKITNNNSRRSDIIKKQEAVMTEIYEAERRASKNVTRLSELKRIFEQYVTMANSDRDVAIRFLLNAHYSEVTDYEDEQLAKIGITRDEIIQYNNRSEVQTEEA